MAYTYGLAGVAACVQTTGQVVTGAIRVFDVVKVSTLGTIALYDGTVVDPLKSYIILSGNSTIFNSNAVVRFPNGLFASCSASGTSCFVNYIKEL